MADAAEEYQETEQIVLLEERRHRRRHPHFRRRHCDCADCGNPIPAERLRVIPEAARCMDCQARLEGTR